MGVVRNPDGGAPAARSRAGLAPV